MGVVIGKYTLESLTSGMYTTPHVIFREYIQNAVDSIDDALEAGIIAAEEARVDILIDKHNKRIMINDNGMGITYSHAVETLVNIGDSNKSLKKQRGFRGIGRLSGLAYCNEIIFQTKHQGETQGTELRFNGAKLTEILIPGKYMDFDLERAITEVVESRYFDEHEDKHYFKVTLEGVKNIGGILNYDQVEDYISQVAPLPYNPQSFSWANRINDVLQTSRFHLSVYNMFISTPQSQPQQLFKLYSDQFEVSVTKHQIDRLTDIKIEQICNSEGKVLGLLWYGESSLLGTILDDRIKGIRFRKGNILVGDKASANQFFKEDRFNGWLQGEIFIINDDIIPNARRDDFENNDTYGELWKRLCAIGEEISKTIRTVSSQRAKQFDAFEKIHILTVENHSAAVTKYPDINICSQLSIKEKKLLEKIFVVLEASLPDDINSEMQNIIISKL